MNTKLATSQVRLSTWSSIIKDRQESGLKVDEYCREHNLSRNAYFYWLRKIKEAALEQSGFVEMTPDVPKNLHPYQSFSPQLTLRIGDCELGVNDETSSELLARTIRVIRNAQ